MMLDILMWLGIVLVALLGAVCILVLAVMIADEVRIWRRRKRYKRGRDKMMRGGEVMAKQSAFLQQIQKQKAADMDIQRRFTIQQCEDMMIIAANAAFHFGPVRAKRLRDAFRAVFVGYAVTALDDGKDDKDIVYTRAKVDIALKNALGENFVEWDERYRQIMPGGGR